MEKELIDLFLNSYEPSKHFEKLRNENQLDLFVEVKDLIGVVQSPIHHAEGDVWNHTMMVLDVASQLKDQTSNPLGFMLTALLHDVGKKETTTIEKDGRIRSIGHENCLHLVRSALRRLNADEEMLEYVTNMTKLHMRPNALVAQKSSQKAFNKVFSQSIAPKDLILFSKADHLGRKNIENYIEYETILKEKYEIYCQQRKDFGKI